MKTLLTIFLSFCFSIPLFAEDLVLKNGKVYRDYKVIKVERKGIKIRYAMTGGYSGTRIIPYGDLKDEDRSKYTLPDVEYTIIGVSGEVDIFLVPIKKKSPEFEVAEKGRYNDPEMAIWYILTLHAAYKEAHKERNEKLKMEIFYLIDDFPFRSTLIRRCEYKKIKTTPVGKIRKIPKGKYICVTLKKCYTDSGQLYYKSKFTEVSINQLQTKIELDMGHFILHVN